MTNKERFLNGDKFYMDGTVLYTVKSDSKIGYYLEGREIEQSDYGYMANISAIQKNSFTWFTYYMGKKVGGRQEYDKLKFLDKEGPVERSWVKQIIDFVIEQKLDLEQYEELLPARLNTAFDMESMLVRDPGFGITSKIVEWERNTAKTSSLERVPEIYLSNREITVKGKKYA
jgi:hypothetical protein